jgi:hypothetical protein
MKTIATDVDVRPADGGFVVQFGRLDATETFLRHADVNVLYESDVVLSQDGWLLRFCGPDIVFTRGSACAYTSLDAWWNKLLAAEAAR